MLRGRFQKRVKQLMGKDTQGVKIRKNGAKGLSEINETLETYLGWQTKGGWRLRELG